MKKLILSAVLVAGTAMASFGQGTVIASNAGNTDTTSTATTSGMFFLNIGGTPVLMDYNVNATYDHLNANLYGGSDVGSLALIYNVVGTDYSTYGLLSTANPGEGTFSDVVANTLSIPSVAGNGLAYMRLQVWWNNGLDDPDFATASGTSGAYTAQVDWSGQPTGGAGSPPFQTPPTSLSSMPAVVLELVPEPGTFTLLGLGAAAMMIFRRRK